MANASTPVVNDSDSVAEFRHQRLHARQQPEGGKAGGEQRQVGAPERGCAVMDEGLRRLRGLRQLRTLLVGFLTLNHLDACPD
jgi:hypothetical protein